MQGSNASSHTSQHDQNVTLLLALAQQAAASADWAAVWQAAKDCLNCMKSVASNPDLSVRALLLQAEAQYKLNQSSEALKVNLMEAPITTHATPNRSPQVT